MEKVHTNPQNLTYKTHKFTQKKEANIKLY